MAVEGVEDDAQHSVSYGESQNGGRRGDPTGNVRDLVRAESLYQNDMRNAEARMQRMAVESLSKMTTYAHEAESRMQSWMRDAETKRIDQLNNTRADYEKRIADMLSESVRSTSALVSTQLLQIQSTFDARVNKLEEFRLTSQGKSSVQDPMLASTLAAIGQNIVDMQSTFSKTLSELAKTQTTATENMTKSIATIGSSQSGSTTTRTSQQQLIGWIVGGILLLAAIASPIISAFALRSH